MPDVTVASPLPGTEGHTAEDFWTPEVAPVPGGLNEAPLPPMKAPPEHDGTSCLKWDDTLWSHADHFKARTPAPLLPGRTTSSWQCRLPVLFLHALLPSIRHFTTFGNHSFI